MRSPPCSGSRTQGPAPARFTGKVRDDIEDGSPAFHVGIEVKGEGPYRVYGRLYDAKGDPIALLDGSAVLATTDHDVKFVAFGKLLRDSAAPSPYSLRDLEAHRVIRETVVQKTRVARSSWRGLVRTRPEPIAIDRLLRPSVGAGGRSANPSSGRGTRALGGPSTNAPPASLAARP